jgi:bifunctional non-homologous end joining protein LigD
VPISAPSISTPRATFPNSVGRHLMRAHPRDITLDWAVEEAHWKDLHGLQHERARQDAERRYSPRGEPGAPVSMPLSWEELAGALPLDFRITNAAERLASTGDRWYDVLERKQSLESALKAR